MKTGFFKDLKKVFKKIQNTVKCVIPYSRSDLCQH